VKNKLIDTEMPALGPKSNFSITIGGRVTE
jgi:hypothetical protein